MGCEPGGPPGKRPLNGLAGLAVKGFASSPGRAVSRVAGAPWEDKLLRLPAFLREEQGVAPSPAELADAFALTGFFLSRYVLEPRGEVPADARAQFLASILETKRAAG